MIKINEVASFSPAAKIKRKKSEDDGVFDGFLSATEEAEAAEASSPAERTAPAQPLSALGGLLSLQEVSDEELRRRQAMQSGQSAIETLEELRRELLFGGPPAERLGAMRQKLTNLRNAMRDVPALEPLMSDIELRLAVEIAKLES